MIEGLQILAIFFSFVMIYLAVLHRKRGDIDKVEFISWVIIWCITLFVVVFPELLRSFATRIFITRLFDLVVVGGFILVITMTARIYAKVRRMENSFEEFIRNEAINDAKKKKK